ncbi:MAG: hypothetical protein OEM38_04620 [Gammaproteobacteria bacterium]|nr:hypothetical protein [Gammaproteobacteria bacterium]
MNKESKITLWRSLKAIMLSGIALLTLSYATTGFAIIYNDPEPTSGTTPPTPPIPTFVRTGSSIKITIKNTSSVEDGYRIQRRSGSNWITIASIGALGTGASYNKTEYGIPSETLRCYRAQVYNEYGTRTSAPRCAYTTDGRDNKVWRVQVELTTSHISNANTDDAIWVRLNTSSPSYEPSGNFTWMDYSTNDFERSDVKKYDLNLSGVSDMSDINRIYFGKSGSNGWCMKNVKLIVNEIDVFEKSFANEASGCHWMDNDNGNSNYYFIGKSEIRNHPKWISYNQNGALLLLTTLGIPDEELEERIEGIVGDMMHDEPLYWGYIYDEAVSVTRGCPNTVTECGKVHVDLDMGASPSFLGIPLPNVGVDVDFDLNFQCNGGTLNISTSNFTSNANYNWLLDILSLGLLGLVDSGVEDAVKNGWKAISQSVPGLPDCKAYVDLNNTVRLEQVE